MMPIREKKGYGLIIFLNMISLLLILMVCGNYSYLITNNIARANRAADSMRAYYVADAGLVDAYVSLRSLGYLPPPPGVGPYVNNAYPVGPGLAGSYTANIVCVIGGSWPEFIIISAGTYHGITRQLELRVTPTPISWWGYLSDSETNSITGSDSWWGTGEMLDGPSHTNGHFNIAGSPVFNGPATQAAPALNLNPSFINLPDFRQGLTLSAPAISINLSTTGLVAALKAAAQASNTLYNGDTTIHLLGNGHMNVDNQGNHYANVAMPNNAVFVLNGTLSVYGIVKGSYTIGCGADAGFSGGDIRIINRIEYHDDPVANPGSADLLGLVAQNNIIVDAGYPSNDVIIDGYLVAVNGSFFAESWNTHTPVGTITCLGGLTNERAGLTAEFIGTTPTYGYLETFIYDTRLSTTTSIPEYFPPARDMLNRILYRKSGTGFREI